MSWWPLPGRRRSALKSSPMPTHPSITRRKCVPAESAGPSESEGCVPSPVRLSAGLPFRSVCPFIKTFSSLPFPASSGQRLCCLSKRSTPISLSKQNSVSGSRRTSRCKSGDGADLGAGRMYFIKGGPRVLNSTSSGRGPFFSWPR